MKILWLASWYPSKLDLFNGDFIQRHAEAASLYNDIEVIHVIKDEKGIITKNSKTVITERGRLTERVIYYFTPLQKIPLLGKLFSEIKYRRLFKIAIKDSIHRQGRPDLVHVHVCMKAGVMALWLKRIFNLPYVVTEHSSIFLPEAETRIANFSVYFRKKCIEVLRNASAITVVSEYLGKNIQRFLKNKEYLVIPNVVNTNIFKPVPKAINHSACFIHVSGLGHPKNFGAILDAFAIAKTEYQNFILEVFGPPHKKATERVRELGLSEFVNFYQEIPQTELAGFMQKADALILYSRYETFGCVVIEANACGTPVIVSDIPTMKENVIDNFNGIIVRKDDPSCLAQVIKAFIAGKLKFNSAQMAAAVSEKYGYERIGASFSAWYQMVLRNLNTTTA